MTGSSIATPSRMSAKLVALVSISPARAPAAGRISVTLRSVPSPIAVRRSSETSFVPKARSYTDARPAMLIVVSDTCRTSKPASRSRATARSIVVASEKNAGTLRASIAAPASNSDAPPIERGDACA